MRRDEFLVTNKETIEEILNECEYGVLSLINENEPYGVPLNFVYFQEKFCFHGAKAGKKIKCIKEDKRASFVGVKEYSRIPSYFSDPNLACPATQFFASVHAQGKVEFVEDVSYKAKILSAFMQKLQKEGGYEPIIPNEMYNKMLKTTAVFTLTPNTISLKIKAGQNVKEQAFQNLINQLEKRGTKKDLHTIEIMKKFR